MNWEIGRTTEGKALLAQPFVPQGAKIPSQPATANFPWLLFIGGVHGNEVEGVWLMEAVCQQWQRAFPAQNCGVVVLPQANPDGCAKGERCNGRNVDLNRNLPSRDWTAEIKNPKYPPGPSAASEPETQALVKLISAIKPIAILSAHSFSNFQVNVNGPSQAWGEELAAICGYPVTQDIGYPTPGCLGTYTGKEMGIPTITLEIERGLPKEKVLSLHLPVIAASLAYWDKEEKAK